MVPLFRDVTVMISHATDGSLTGRCQRSHRPRPERDLPGLGRRAGPETSARHPVDQMVPFHRSAWFSSGVAFACAEPTAQQRAGVAQWTAFRLLPS